MNPEFLFWERKSKWTRIDRVNDMFESRMVGPYVVIASLEQSCVMVDLSSNRAGSKNRRSRTETSIPCIQRSSLCFRSARTETAV